MLSRMAPSSPPDMRTLHLLRTPDILCANDSRQFGNYQLNNTAQDCLLLRNFRVGGHPGEIDRGAQVLPFRCAGRVDQAAWGQILEALAPCAGLTSSFPQDGPGPPRKLVPL